MSPADRRNSRKLAGAPDVVPAGGQPTRTIPSLEIEAVRKEYERILRTRRHVRVGTVHLGPEMLQEHTDPAVSARMEPPALESESGEGETVARESVLAAAGPRREVTPTPARPTEGLEALIAALDRETLSDEPPPYLPSRLGERFEGMMRGGTLEMKVDPAWLTQEDEPPREERADGVDVQRLVAQEVKKQVLPNSYMLSDEEVSRAFAETLGLNPLPEGDKLIAVGRLARLEARIVDHFARIGRAYRELVTDCSRPQFAALKRVLAKAGVLTDPDVQEALRRWRASQAASGSGGRVAPSQEKLARMVGVSLVRKRGDVLCRLRLPQAKIPGSLIVVQREVRAVKRAFDARREIIQREFDGNKALFATSFLVQRGPNARPGFFWNDETCLDL